MAAATTIHITGSFPSLQSVSLDINRATNNHKLKFKLKASEQFILKTFLNPINPFWDFFLDAVLSRQNTMQHKHRRENWFRIPCTSFFQIENQLFSLCYALLQCFSWSLEIEKGSWCQWLGHLQFVNVNHEAAFAKQGRVTSQWSLSVNWLWKLCKDSFKSPLRAAVY